MKININGEVSDDIVFITVGLDQAQSMLELTNKLKLGIDNQDG